MRAQGSLGAAQLRHLATQPLPATRCHRRTPYAEPHLSGAQPQRSAARLPPDRPATAALGRGTPGRSRSASRADCRPPDSGQGLELSSQHGIMLGESRFHGRGDRATGGRTTPKQENAIMRWSRGWRCIPKAHLRNRAMKRFHGANDLGQFRLDPLEVHQPPVSPKTRRSRSTKSLRPPSPPSGVSAGFGSA